LPMRRSEAKMEDEVEEEAEVEEVEVEAAAAAIDDDGDDDDALIEEARELRRLASPVRPAAADEDSFRVAMLEFE
jgi:hypothetical protein